MDPLAISQGNGDSLPPDTTQGRVRRAFLRTVPAGQVLFEIGDPGEPLFVVQAGEVALLEAGAEGAARLLARLGPGDPVGETDAVLGRSRTVRAVATTDARLLQLDRETFREMCLARPEIALRIVERLAQRTADLERRLGALGMNDLVRPVVRSLLRHAPAGAAGSARLALGLRAIAESAGLSLRDAHRGLCELFDRKLVRLVEDALLVPDVSALAACLEDDSDSTGSGSAR
ncbi:MAG: Crp/Fnr family transcriptional regulator [Deltaproteobacteria bacterium]|nr:Crp/Fnr family transcriptional regulator [Deltaproteobacteria bacterium]